MSGMYDKNGPWEVQVKAGESVWVCACGHTKTPPMCDGSHNQQPGSAGPVEIKAEQDETLWLCGCGKSGNLPYCDGSHNG